MNRQDALYEEAVTAFGAALERLARAYEADPDRRRDLLQDIHVAVWQSCEGFDRRSSLRTWVYRVAHNTAISRTVRHRRRQPSLVSLDELAAARDGTHDESLLDRRLVLDRLLAIIQTLRPMDRQVILLYLEDVDAASIGEIVGLSSVNVATKIHRVKQILSKRFHEGGRYGS